MVTANYPTVAASPPPICPGRRRWPHQVFRLRAVRRAEGPQHPAELLRAVGQQTLAELLRAGGQQPLAESRRLVWK